jgi:AraC family transcriptional regulator
VFLLYRNRGERRFGLKPIFAYPRGAWQYQFIIEGETSITFRTGNREWEERLVAPVLSVTGPDCVHGFEGRPSDFCKVIVFHFDEADFTVRTIIGHDGYRRIPFSSAETPALHTLYERCGEARKTIGTTPAEAKKRAGFFEPLIYGIVGSEITLFILRHIPKAELGYAPNFSESKVSGALAWYEANLPRNPTMSDVADAVHLSPTHLRRLFHKIRGVSPQVAFTEIQFKRVKWLMRDPAMTFERIADFTGFGSASAFSRAFAKEFGLSPKAYRKTLASAQ